MNKSGFATPQDAENAFYEALENGDVDAMMDVWADDEEIVCVHPGGPRLTGYEAVLQSWSRIFRSGQRLKVDRSEPVVLAGMMLTVHSLHENITTSGDQSAPARVAATNAYLRTASGWRMIVHHASPEPQAARAPSPVPDLIPPKILH